MNDFWTNISRYPRFFISSLIGLILIILAPFRNLLKIRKLRFLFSIFILIFILSLYLIIKTTDLQSAPFNHSGTDPFHYINLSIFKYKKQY